MIIHRKKLHRIHRTLLLLAIALMTMLVFVVGDIAGPFYPSSAHAAPEENGSVAPSPLCASDPTGPHCNNQDPMAQTCNKDAQTIAYKEIINQQGTLLATVQRRYSPTCHSEWGRIIESPFNSQPVSISIGSNAIQTTSGPLAFTTMVFITTMNQAPKIIGMVSINGTPPDQDGGAGLAAILPALPAT